MTWLPALARDGRPVPAPVHVDVAWQPCLLDRLAKPTFADMLGRVGAAQGQMAYTMGTALMPALTQATMAVAELGRAMQRSAL